MRRSFLYRYGLRPPWVLANAVVVSISVWFETSMVLVNAVAVSISDFHIVWFETSRQEVEEPTFYPNHRARNPHPGDGLDPLLGPRIFRALRLGLFEGFPASM